MMDDEAVLEIGAGRSPDPRATVTLDIRSDLEHVDYGGVDVAHDRWPFEDDRFDRVVARHVLEHVPPDRLGDLFEEADRVLTDGGAFEIVVPHAGSWDANTDATHYGTGGWTPDVEGYFTGDLEPYWPNLDWDVTARAHLSVPSFLRESVRLSFTTGNGGLSTELVKIPFVTGVVTVLARKRGSSSGD